MPGPQQLIAGFVFRLNGATVSWKIVTSVLTRGVRATIYQETQAPDLVAQ